ncbi:carbonic anhydrase [Nocardioides luteus]|uniref:carbonic anhydrase n=1 Tax=Nocardioides luteus TaxID=1844 RepID=UPI000AF87F79|nr:carbonic anhydrase [Nocardioides luteus]
MVGNERFVADSPDHPNQDAVRRAEVVPGQKPFAVLFGCSDSRLSAEIIFDRGLSHLFVVHTAGHVTGS